jgi:CARDB
MRNHPVTIATLAMLSCGAALAAEHVSWVEISQNYIVPPKIEVAAKAHGYTAVTTHSLTWQITRSAACGNCGDVGSRLDIKRLSTDDEWFADWKVTAESVFEIDVNKSRSLTEHEKLSALNVCKNYLEQQMAAGKSKAWVLSQDHQLEGPKLFTARHSVSMATNGHVYRSSTMALVNPVVCKHSPVLTPGSLTQPPAPPIPPGPGDLQQTFAVREATLAVTPKQATVVTHANLAVHGTVKTNGKGQVRYRISHNGGLGTVKALNFAKAGVKSVSFPLNIRCPKEGQQEQQSGGGGIGGLAAAPSNVKNGYLRLIVVSPTSGATQSNDAAYSVTCRKTGQLALPLPDLKVTGAKWTAGGLGPQAGGVKPESLAIEVRNVGAKGAVATRLRVTGTVGRVQHSWTAPIPALGAGKEALVEVELTASGPVGLPLDVRLDVPPKVKESDEGNNTYHVD